MQHLTTPTGLYIGGRWLQPGDAVPGDVVGFDYEKAARKGMIEAPGGEEVRNPGTSPEAPAREEAPDPGSEVTRLTGELEEERRKVADLDARAGTLTTQLREAVEARGTAREEATRLAADLEREREVVRLPADARERLIRVPGIAGALADKAILALTAPAEPPTQPE